MSIHEYLPRRENIQIENKYSMKVGKSGAIFVQRFLYLLKEG